MRKFLHVTVIGVKMLILTTFASGPITPKPKGLEQKSFGGTYFWQVRNPRILNLSAWTLKNSRFLILVHKPRNFGQNNFF